MGGRGGCEREGVGGRGGCGREGRVWEGGEGVRERGGCGREGREWEGRVWEGGEGVGGRGGCGREGRVWCEAAKEHATAIQIHILNSLTQSRDIEKATDYRTTCKIGRASAERVYYRKWAGPSVDTTDPSHTESKVWWFSVASFWNYSQPKLDPKRCMIGQN